MKTLLTISSVLISFPLPASAGQQSLEAFDRLVSLDPRYRWVESEGVVIFRPLNAWTDPCHR